MSKRGAAERYSTKRSECSTSRLRESRRSLCEDAPRRQRKRRSPSSTSSDLTSDSSFTTSSSSSSSSETSPEHPRRQEHTKKRKKSRDKTKSKKKRKTSDSKSDKGPVQLSKYMDDRRQRSAVSGKVIKMRVKKSSKDKQREKNRKELLAFLNASTN